MARVSFTFDIGFGAPDALLTACNIGPKYTQTIHAGSAGLQGARSAKCRRRLEAGSARRRCLARGKWWERFNDPQLNELEEKLNISNQNIAAAAAQRSGRARHDPGSPGAILSHRHRQPGHHQFSSLDRVRAIRRRHILDVSLPLEASWEPDLWGRIRNTVNANTFAAQASVADLENVRLSAQADLAADYYELRAQDALKQLLDSTRQRLSGGSRTDPRPVQFRTWQR